MNAIFAMAGLGEAYWQSGLQRVKCELVVIGVLALLCCWRRWRMFSVIVSGSALVVGILLSPWRAFAPLISEDPDLYYWVGHWRIACWLWTAVFVFSLASTIWIFRNHPNKRKVVLCNRALEAVRPLIPSNLHIEVSDYINRHDEWGVGMELLVDQLSELGIQITKEQFGLIESAMASMGLAEDLRVTYLRDHYVAA